MAWRLTGAKPLLQPVMNECQLDSSKDLSYLKSKFSFNKNVFWNVVCKMSAISPRSRYIKSSKWQLPVQPRNFIPNGDIYVSILVGSIAPLAVKQPWLQEMGYSLLVCPVPNHNKKCHNHKLHDLGDLLSLNYNE